MANIRKYEPLKIEPEIMDYWAQNKIYETARLNGKKEFYFLDGPPYTSGKVHIGTAWNKSLKDCILRYKRAIGFKVWDRAGYDMHGMPTANAVMKKLGMKHKDEIPKFGVAKFIEECKNLSLTNLDAMNKDFARLGIWMDFKNAYQTIKPEFIEGEWWLVKKAHENKRLYEGEKVMHWCAQCATSLAKHELEYKNVKDDSIFLKFKLKGRNEYLIIWTTTPWTIPFNLGVMANPDIDYIKAKVGEEIWITAKALAGALIQGVANKKMEILEEFKGEKLEGTEYIHPFYSKLKNIYDDLKKKSPKVHTVVMSKKYVDLSAGSGMVHMAPGCGPEDYEIGRKNKIPHFNNLDEEGKFPDDMGDFAGWTAKKDDKKFIEELKSAGALIAVSPVEHEYAHCWRCHKPVIFKTTKQWFFKIEDLIPKMRKFNKEVFWQPDWAGKKWFDSWLENLRDNGITRQRYWGTPLPIWRCSKCPEYIVIGSAKELSRHAEVPEDLHRPYIDKVEFKCEKCSGIMKRIPDILDVWVDAGTTSWTCLDYPQKQDLFKKLWPPDFILEGKDQIRGWFNLLLIASMVSMEKPSYKAVYMHGWINDAQGRKMSKSLGNYILPSELIDKWGADTLRYYAIGGANPGLDLNYNLEDTKIKHRNLIILWNIHKYLIDLAKETGENPAEIEVNDFSIEEKYMLSKLNNGIDKATKAFEEYALNEVPLIVEDIFLNLSRGYIKFIRDKAVFGSKEDKYAVLHTIYKALFECLKLFTPITPFICEKIYLNLKNEFRLKRDSISLFEWPKPDYKMINLELEKQMDIAGGVIQAILSCRERLGRGLRWPLGEVIIVSSNADIVNAVDSLKDIIMQQTNVKEISIRERFEKIGKRVKADFGKLEPEYGGKISAMIVAHIGTTSPETVLGHIENEGKYEFKVDSENVAVTRNHLLFERDVPDSHIEGEFRNGFVYVNKKINEELEAEGYAREIMRRVQALRKEKGLQKMDRISLHLTVNNEFKKMIEPWIEQIKEKVGADEISFGAESVKKEFISPEKIKKTEFEIGFDKT
ncbi:isoleucine--tRNA ligase [Candidatus Woesearchaeota archaeon]|nr:isoleucine--tRNA ligase [Candidatus Woesearchaeota archaeon]